MARNIMIQGTMSGAGKSLLTAALCRIFLQDGYRVAPFKSQNMALNSYITADGLEMGRAQVLQAQAAGKAPDVRMNPILLKPSSDVGSQVIVNGEVLGNYRATDYFRMKKSLIPQILEAYYSLAEENDIIVIEGAGSPAEINLKKDDIVNMGLAEMVDAPVILVGDIDPGGVFAQLYGTVALLPENERARIVGTVINKFRGDVEILRPGLSMLEELIGVPVLGVVPYTQVDLDDEDSLSPRLQGKMMSGLQGKTTALQQDRTGGQSDARLHRLDIAVIRMPRISNFTDFTPLSMHPDLGVRYAGSVKELGTPDLVILPGTKNTMGDLAWIRQNGLEAAILKLHAAGTPVFGVCGGFQMLGERLLDPEGVEHGGEMAGMGLLPCRTVFSAEKVRTQEEAVVCAPPFSGARLKGYQIHMGRTEFTTTTPFCTLSDGTPEGAAAIREGASCGAAAIRQGASGGEVFGTYLHGLFDTGELTEKLAGWLMSRKGPEADVVSTAADAEGDASETAAGNEMAEIVVGKASGTTRPESHEAWQEKQLDLLADIVRNALDMEKIYKVLGQR